MGGPTPKRDAERRRANKPPVDTAEIHVNHRVAPPPADDDWHPIAAGWYTSLTRSAVSQFYDESDWHTAWVLSEELSREFKPQVIGTHPETGKAVWAKVPMKAATLAAFLKGCSALLATEGDRRRARIETVKAFGNDEAAEAAGVPNLHDRRQRLTG